MQPSRPRSIAQWWPGRWPWAAAVVAGALLLWIGSCTLCRGSEEPGRERAPAESPPVHRSDADAQIAALRMALDREVEAREQLATEVQSLREKMAQSPESAAAGAPSPDLAEGLHRPKFDPDALVAAGVAREEAQELRSRWEALEMEKIQLNDRAARGGWAGSAQYQREMAALDRRLREQASDADYDRYLYATGHSNRARVTDVLAGSPAADAGFRPGDTIVEYDGARVYTIDELRDRATRSRPDDSVRIEVVRNGSRTTLDARGGPLGLLLVPERQAPL
jgi:hypothetical protein